LDKYKEKRNDRSEAVAKYFKYGFIGFIALIVIAVALVVFFTYKQSYVATVGSEKISVAEYKFFLKQEKSNMLAIAGVQAGTPEEETFWSSKMDGENAINVAREKALDRARDLKIQVIKAKEQGIKLEKSDTDGLENAIKQFITQNNESRTEANKASEELYGVKLDEVQNIYKQIILMQKLLQKESDSMKISEDDLAGYYEKNPDWFKDSEFRKDAEEAVWARHILIKSSKDATAEEQEKAKKKAEDILQKVKNGEDFAKLAGENSEDTGSAQYGGDYVFGKGKMDNAFETAAFGLEPGQTSGLVETTIGYHIIKLEEKIPQGQPVSLKCAKDYREFGTSLVRSKLYDQKLEEWKKDPVFELKKNQSVYDGIK